MEKIRFTVLGVDICLTLGLFRNVKNIKDLTKKCKLESFFYNKQTLVFFLDGQMVLDVEHITHGVYRAFYNFKTNTMKTKNLVLEILYFMSAHEQVKECIQQLEIKCDSSTIVFVGVNMEETFIKSIIENVDGELMKFSEIYNYHDKKKILQNYKHIYEKSIKEDSFKDIVLYLCILIEAFKLHYC